MTAIPMRPARRRKPSHTQIEATIAALGDCLHAMTAADRDEKDKEFIELVCAYLRSAGWGRQ